MVRPSGLGKGLGALIPTGLPEPGSGPGAGSSAAPDGARLVEVPVTAIRPNAYQPRSTFDEESLASLAASIKELGVLQPVLLRPAGDGMYELIAGERRWRAARRAGLETIPAVVRTAEGMAALEQALVENLHRADLNAMEEAAAYQQLIDDFRLTHEEIATRVGKSRAAVTNTLRLFQLSPAIQRLVIESQLSAGHARALLGTSDKAFQESLARRAVAEALSVRQVEEAVRLRTELGDKPKAKAEPKPPRVASLVELEELLAAQLDTRVSVSMGPKRGKIVIEFADLDDLERIYRSVAHEG